MPEHEGDSVKTSPKDAPHLTRQICILPVSNYLSRFLEIIISNYLLFTFTK